MPLKVRSITPRGSAALSLGGLNILVGANNSGKSQTLRDIRDYAISGSTNRLTILEHLEVELPNEAEAMSGLSVRPHPNPGHSRMLGVANDLQNRHE